MDKLDDKKTAMNQKKLDLIVAEHALWLADLLTGYQADFRWDDLRGLDFRRASLREADFRWADCREANFREADCREANFHEADCREANFREADLRYAGIHGTNFFGTDVRGVILD